MSSSFIKVVRYDYIPNGFSCLRLSHVAFILGWYLRLVKISWNILSFLWHLPLCQCLLALNFAKNSEANLILPLIQRDFFLPAFLLKELFLCPLSLIIQKTVCLNLSILFHIFLAYCMLSQSGSFLICTLSSAIYLNASLSSFVSSIGGVTNYFYVGLFFYDLYIY